MFLLYEYLYINDLILELGFNFPYPYWKLGIHYLGLPGCNAYTNIVPQIATFLPGKKKQKQPALGLNDDHRSTNHQDKHAQACMCTYSVHSLVVYESVCGA